MYVRHGRQDGWTGTVIQTTRYRRRGSLQELKILGSVAVAVPVKCQAQSMAAVPTSTGDGGPTLGLTGRISCRKPRISGTE